MKQHKIHLNSFNADVWYFWDCSPQQIAKYLRRRRMDVNEDVMNEIEQYTVEEHSLGACFLPPQNQAIVWLNKRPYTPSGVGILVHETIHAFAHIAREVRFDVDFGSEEVMCYTVDHCVEEVLKVDWK